MPSAQHDEGRMPSPQDDWLLALGAASLLLFMGRTNFGSWYDLVPMHAHINVMRYTNAVQFCGMLFAAIAGGAMLGRGQIWLRQTLREKLHGRLSAELVGRVVVAAGVIAGGWYALDRADSFSGTLKTFNHNHANVGPVIEHLREGRGQRFAVSKELNTSPHFFRDLFPALAGRAQLQSYALGYHATLSTYYADYIQYDSPAWARLFNVGDFLARGEAGDFDAKVVEDYHESFRQGPYRVYEPVKHPDWGYFDFVRTPLAVHGDFREIRPGVRSLLVPGFERRVLPVLEGPTAVSQKAARPVLTARDPAHGNREVAEWLGPDDTSWRRFLKRTTDSKPIRSEIISSRRGRHWYEAEIDVPEKTAAAEGERLMLKVNYFPFWQVTIDGEPADEAGGQASPDHIAPNFMAVDVPAGRHTVRFTYRNPWWQKVGALVTLLALLVWIGWTTVDSAGYLTKARKPS